MWRDLKISVVIPTLNEAEGIRQTIQEIPKFVDEIIVVDGGSKDATRDIAASCGAKVVLEQRRGYGRAFKTGFENATGDIIATTDGDGTYPIEKLPEILEKMATEDKEFISCSRFPLQDRSSMRKRNFIGNKAITLVAAALWMKHFDDILSGMWVFRRRALVHMYLQSDSWNFSEEIKIAAYAAFGRQFGEFRIPYRERLGETKLVPWKVGIQNIVYLFALRMGRVSMMREMLGRPAEARRQLS
jgi:glycosyltransferase involved in cell wall biosynthesis